MIAEVLLSHLSSILKEKLNTIDQMYSQLLKPNHLSTVLQNILDPQISFAFCLAVKGRIKRKNRSSSLLTFPEVYSYSQESKSGHYAIFEFNPLWLKINQRAKNEENLNIGKCLYQIVAKLSLDQYYFYGHITYNDQWRIYLNYLYVLLYSLKAHQTSQALTLTQRQVQSALVKFRDELIAKLIFQCLIYPIPLKFMLSIFFNEIQSVLPDERIIGQKLTNIFRQMSYYLNNQACSDNLADMQAIGKEMTIFALNLCDRFLEMRSKAIVSNLINIILQLVRIHKPKRLVTTFRNCQDSKIEEQLQTQECQQVLPAYISNNSQKFTKVIYQIIDCIFLDGENIQWQLVEKINEIILVISSNYVLSSNDILRPDFKQIEDRNKKGFKQILYLFEKIAYRSTKMINKLDPTNFYFEYSTVKAIMKILCKNIEALSQGLGLLQYLLKSCFPIWLSKIKICFQNNQVNLISVLFHYLFKIMSLLKNNDYNSSGLMQQIKYIFHLFIMKCVDSEFQQQFDNFNEQFQASKSYFKAPVQIFLLIESQANQKSLFRYLYQQIEVVISKNQKKGHYFFRFILQLIKSDSLSKSSRIKAHQMSIFLLQHLKETVFQKEYLSVLDVITDKLIDPSATEFDHTISELWYYISKSQNPYVQQPNLSQFTNLLADYLVGILTTQKEKYFVTYVINIICRTCKRLAQVEQNRKNSLRQFTSEHRIKPTQSLKNFRQSLIQAYMYAVYSFFTNLELQALNQVGHFQNRSEFFEVIAFLGVATAQDVYAIFNSSILRNIDKFQDEESLYFLTDTTGLLRANNKQIFNEIFLQLTLDTIKEHPQILDILKIQTLKTNELCFKIFYDFIMVIAKCSRSMNLKHSVVIPSFLNSISQLINNLHTIYDTSNYNEIYDIILAFVEEGYPMAFLPLLPKKLYCSETQAAQKLIIFYCQHLLRVKSNQQIQIIFRNIFQRDTLDWQSHQTVNFNARITRISQASEILLYFVDYIDAKKCQLFFNTDRLIENLLEEYYSKYLKRAVAQWYDSQLSVNPRDNEYFHMIQDILENFFRSQIQKEQMKNFATALHTLKCLTTGQQVNYSKFEKVFLKQMRDKLKMMRTWRGNDLL